MEVDKLPIGISGSGKSYIYNKDYKDCVQVSLDLRDRGISDNHPFYCPDCWDDTEPEYSKHPKSDEWVEKGNEWLKENRK